jgi:deaminated glutathione amidase
MTKIAVAQFASGFDKGANLDRIRALAERSAREGAHAAVFPEGAMHTFGELKDDLAPAAEPLDGPFVDALSVLATKVDMTIVAGMFESIPGQSRIHNTAVVVGPRKGLIAHHRKHHLYDAFEERESDRILAGDADPPLFELGGFQAALVVCYELRFPAYIQELADRGAEILVVPSAWVAGPLKEEHWMVMVRARAIENTMYVAGAGMIGQGYCGKSMIVDPMGVVVASLGEADGVAVGDISKERLSKVRARLPLVEQRRAAAKALVR